MGNQEEQIERKVFAIHKLKPRFITKQVNLLVMQALFPVVSPN